MPPDVTVVAPMDQSLIVPLIAPERPTGKVTNGDLQDAIERLNDAIILDNDRKRRLLESLAPSKP